MVKRKDIRENAHANKALAHGSWKDGQGGRPSKVDEVVRPGELREKVQRQIAVGLSQADLGRSLGLARNTIQEWLRHGELAVTEGVENGFAEFYRMYWETKASVREKILGELIESADDRVKERWLLRTSDGEGSYVDMDRVAGRSETNIQILNRENLEVNLLEGLELARQRVQLHGPSIEGEVRELPAGEGEASDG